jgi:putative transposase
VIALVHLLVNVVVAPQAAAAFELLLERKKTQGQVSAHLVRTVADLCGKSEDTIWRWLREGTPKKRKSLGLTDEETKALAACRGNVAEMVIQLERAGKARASVRTYQRAVNQSLTPATRGFFKTGDKGWRAATVHMPQTVERRGQVFHADHTLLKIWLRSKRRSRWVQVWLTVVLDAFSRRVMGWTVSLQPNEGIVLVVLRQAFSGEYGCVPDRMVWDNGAEFLANGVTQAATALTFEAHPIAPYSPWQNGKVERFFGTLNTKFLARQPFYRRGPRGHNRKLYGPQDGPLTVEEFTRRLAEWIDEYNREHHHNALDSKTPDEAWRENPTPVRRVDERTLDFMLLREKKPRLVGHHGVRHNSRFYYADEILAHPNREIHVRYMPHDNRQIWLFDGDEFIAEAIAWEELPGKDLDAFFAKRTATLNSARSKLPGRSTNDEEPKSTFLPVTAPGDFVSGEPTVTSDEDLVDSLNEAIEETVDADRGSRESDEEIPDLWGVVE